MVATKPENIDSYIALFPTTVQQKLEELRALIRKTVPQAEETISYAMPTFRFHGVVAHFAAFKNHIGFYPAPTGVEAFRDDLAKYHTGRGSVQFPLDQPLPERLITAMVKFRVEANEEKLKKKKPAARKTAVKKTKPGKS